MRIGVVLYGDSQTGLKILQAPDGAWRTRHLRLRCFVVRKRVNLGMWKVRHLPGSRLASDLLTKVITQPGAWQAFYEFMGLKAAGRAALDEAESCEGPGERGCLGRCSGRSCSLEACREAW